MSLKKALSITSVPGGSSGKNVKEAMDAAVAARRRIVKRIYHLPGCPQSGIPPGIVLYGQK